MVALRFKAGDFVGRLGVTVRPRWPLAGCRRRKAEKGATSCRWQLQQNDGHPQQHGDDQQHREDQAENRA